MGLNVVRGITMVGSRLGYEFRIRRTSSNPFRGHAEAHKGQIEPLIFRAFSCFLAVVKRVYRMA